MDDSAIGAAPKEGAYQDWKLTTSYQQAAKAEMERIAQQQVMVERSAVGDHRLSWQEAEARRPVGWKKEQDRKEKEGISTLASSSSASPLKHIKLEAAAPQRRPRMDFDFEHYKDDTAAAIGGSGGGADHENVHMEAMRHNRSLFEKQRSYRKQLVSASCTIIHGLSSKM